jgi:hypothetical protein
MFLWARLPDGHDTTALPENAYTPPPPVVIMLSRTSEATGGAPWRPYRPLMQ